MSSNDERGLLSRLPQDPAYWDRLTARITADAAPRVRTWHSGEPWWSTLGRWSPLLAAAAVAAVLAAATLLPREAAAPAPMAEAFDFTPADPVARVVLSAAAPPAVPSLLRLQTGGNR